MEQYQTFGSFTAKRGKLSPGDSRGAYVEGPTQSGGRGVLASLSTYGEAVEWARLASLRNDTGGEWEVTWVAEDGREYIRAVKAGTREEAIGLITSHVYRQGHQLADGPTYSQITEVTKL